MSPDGLLGVIEQQQKISRVISWVLSDYEKT